MVPDLWWFIVKSAAPVGASKLYVRGFCWPLAIPFADSQPEQEFVLKNLVFLLKCFNSMRQGNTIFRVVRQ